MLTCSRRIAAALCVLALAVAGCSSDPLVVMEAEIVESDVPAEVSVSRGVDGGVPSHTVTLTWLSDEPAAVGDAQFLRYFPAGGHTEITPEFSGPGRDLEPEPSDPQPSEMGALYIAGPACTWAWPEELGPSIASCGDGHDPQVLAHGESVEYRISWYSAYLNPDAVVAPGTYVVEEPVAWWAAGANRQPIAAIHPPDGTFTIRLIYTAP